jgi:hypothetical protein
MMAALITPNYTTSPDNGSICNCPQMSLIYARRCSNKIVDDVMLMADNIFEKDPDDDLYYQMPIIYRKSQNRSAVPLSITHNTHGRTGQGTCHMA